MRIGVYVGSWRLTRLGGMGVYLQNLLGAVSAAGRRHATGGSSPTAAEIILLVDRSNRASAADLALDAQIVTLDRPAFREIPRKDVRRVIATRALSFRDVEAADARKGDPWTDAAWQYLWGLDEAVRAAEIDLLYFTIPPYLKWPRVPVVLTIHDLKHLHRPQDHDRADLARRRRWGRVARRADLVYSSYEHVRRDVVERLGVAAIRTTVLPLAAPAELRTRFMIDANGPIKLSEPGCPQSGTNENADPPARITTAPVNEPFALIPAQFWAHKNHALVFLALANIRRSHGIEIPLICTGQTDGECAAHAAQMRGLAEKLGIARQVHMLGFVTREQLRNLYDSCRVVIVASLYEAGSFPAMEALALGKPLIASRVTSNPETVGDAAELFDPHDSNDLSAKLLTLWTDADRRATLAARGPARIPDRTWADVSADWLMLCRDTLARGPGSRFVAESTILPPFAELLRTRGIAVAAQ